MKREINFQTWPRYQHYLFFKDFDIPRYNMTFPMDVSRLYQHFKNHTIRFYYGLMHIVIEEMNRIDNFQYRIEGGKVFQEPIEHVSFTNLIAGTDLFKMVFVKVHPDVLTFQTQAMEASRKQGSQLIRLETEHVLNTIYVTSFPWASFNHFTHATKLGSADSIPRVSWSQFVEENGKKMLNLSIEAHHGLVDGVHLGLLINRLQERFNQAD